MMNDAALNRYHTKAADDPVLVCVSLFKSQARTMLTVHKRCFIGVILRIGKGLSINRNTTTSHNKTNAFLNGRHHQALAALKLAYGY